MAQHQLAKQIWTACGYFLDPGWFGPEPGDDDLTWRTISTLEERELTDADLLRAADVLHVNPPPGYDGTMDTMEFPVLPCSTLADCLLRRAAALGRADSARLLLSAGARIDIDESALDSTASLGSPLVNACEAGHLEVVRLLIDERADLDALTQCNQIDLKDSTQPLGSVFMDWGPLHAACAWGNLEVVKMLVNARASIGLSCKYSGYGDSDPTFIKGPTGFHLACARGHISVVTFLHEQCGCADVEAPGQLYGFVLAGDGDSYEDYDEPTFGWSVTEHEQRESQYGIPSAWMRFPDSYGLRDGLRTQCSFPSHLPSFSWIPINAAHLITGSPLLLACIRGCLDVVRYLLRCGADPEAKGNIAWAATPSQPTPLSVLQAFQHCSFADYGASQDETLRYTECIQLLLSAAADGSKTRRTAPIKVRAARVGIQLEDTPPGLRTALSVGGPIALAKAQLDLRGIQKARLQRVSRAEQAGTVRAAAAQSKNTKQKAVSRAAKAKGVPRPRGRAPQGKEWDHDLGKWV